MSRLLFLTGCALCVLVSHVSLFAGERHQQAENSPRLSYQDVHYEELYACGCGGGGGGGNSKRLPPDRSR